MRGGFRPWESFGRFDTAYVFCVFVCSRLEEMNLDFAVNLMVLFQGAIFSMLGYHMISFNKLVRRVDKNEWRLARLYKVVMAR